VVEITDDGVVIDKDGEKITLGGFDNVVIAVGVKAVNDLAEKLQGKAPEVIVIGDAREARKALQDVHEGYEAGLQV
jgi:2,4-dienoyl-CoA reductase (NADPH2)